LSMADHTGRWSPPFTPVELRQMWTYRDGDRTVKAYRTGNWTVVDPETGNAQGEVAAGEFSRRFSPVDEFADVTGFDGYLGVLNAPDGTALVDLILDRNPFMLANGSRRTARPHVLIVPRAHRDGWSSATDQELAARDTAMRLVATWYQSLDSGHAVFAANDSAPNLDYQGDVALAAGTRAVASPEPPVTRNPRQEVQHAHLHAFYAEDSGCENHESSALAGHPVLALGHQVFSAVLEGDAVQPGNGSAGIRAAARPWGGSYCSYRLGLDGPWSVMPALGRSQDRFNQRLAQADGLRATPDPRLGGAVNLVRLSLDAEGRQQAAQEATAEQRASFEAFAARRGG
jgi:hypothetical protein